MRKFLPIVFLLIVVMAGYIFFDPVTTYARDFMYYSICEDPKTYRVGKIDNRYNMTEEEFRTYIKKSETIWEENYGGELFSYDPEGQIEINLVYDRRSFLSTQIDALDSQVKAKQNDLTPKINEYKRRAEEFRNKINQLNADIDYWNERGGAPPEEYDKLIERQRALSQESDALRSEAESLNQSTALYNEQVGELKSTVENFNQELSYKPEQGEYIYDSGAEIINIYFENSESELVHTLAHELGHALRVDHNNNSLSIMYPETTETVTLSADDIEGLRNACAEKNILKEGSDRLTFFINQFAQNISR